MDVQVQTCSGPPTQASQHRAHMMKDGEFVHQRLFTWWQKQNNQPEPCRRDEEHVAPQAQKTEKLLDEMMSAYVSEVPLSSARHVRVFLLSSSRREA